MKPRFTRFALLVALPSLAFLLGACSAQKSTPGPSPAAGGTGTDGSGGTWTGGSAAPKLRPATEKQPASPEAVKKNLEAAAQAAAKQRAEWQGKTFEEFERSVYKEPGEGGKYIVNGDTPIADRKHLKELFDTSIKKEPRRPARPNTELILGTTNGQDAKWNNTDKQHITYCVSTAFGSRQQRVIADMQAAGGAWMQVADVDFTHVPSEDTNCDASNNNVVFDVRPVNVDGEYLARAFFPNEPRIWRNVLIDESSFHLNPSDTLQLVGILRHELGHTLGLRHEQTRPEAGTCFEDTDWRPLTEYDRFSVMHYPQCNGGGDWSLTLTGCDKKGIACVYGPASGFQMGSVTCEISSPCQMPTPGEPPPAGSPKIKKYDNKRVLKDQKKQYRRFRVDPGTQFTVAMRGHGANPGDPDLYVRFEQAPDLGWSQYDCRPFLSGADETCSLDVPVNASKAYVMVHGYAAGRYDLTITYTGRGQ